MAASGIGRPFAAAAIAAFVLSGCDSEEPVRTGTYDRDPETGRITASAPMGEGIVTMQSGSAIAAPLPIELPVMPGAEITEATHVSAPSGLRIALVEMVSGESPAAVAAYYRAAADVAGLTSAFDMGGRDAVTFIAIGEGRERMTLHAARARIAADGSRLSETEGNGGAIEPDRSTALAREYREATIIQLHVVGRSSNKTSRPES